MRETIYAPAGLVGRTALTVLRLSGPRTGEMVAALAGGLPAPRVASLRSLRDAAGRVLDRALVLWFPGPRSYTGEDCAELHLHGGGAVFHAVSEALTALGARPAEAGEFTRRAVLEGKLDLLEAEATLDLIEAETDTQRAQALRHLSGEMSGVAEAWRASLLRLLAHQEALIDFPDEDLPPEVDAALRDGIAALRGDFARALAEGARGEKLRSGVTIAIVGAPNAGKSTLLNALCRRDIAIVSPIAGTTRDVLEARIVLEGVPVTLLDTAGLRDTVDPIEAEGVRRARARLQEADMVLALSEDGAWPDVSDGSVMLHVRTKSDVSSAAVGADVAISAVSGAGMTELLTALSLHVRNLAGVSAAPTLTRARHRAVLLAAEAQLEAAEHAEWPELRGEHLRQAMRDIGRLTGMVDTEEVLGSIFGEFCIGK
ncbi:MAG: tRNA uridine-5-carboxymethylaminomethyl(34) synthesis GTPase MnmE [Acetobacteraceae bacterium]|nr:tRNA uridine-5-carboxymethylaminomethyl(34) synthesis GTPase MnmE [Acetobacteraceae bacterium]